MDDTPAARWAAEARRVRAEVVEGLSAGRVALSDVLAAAVADPLVARIDVVVVVQALPGWGKVSSRRALADLGIAERSPLGEVDGTALARVFGDPP